jgi:hypothetical protein
MSVAGSMKRIVIVVWILGTALAIPGLLPGVDPPPRGFWGFFVLSLVCYSAPFLILSLTRIPKERALDRSITLVMFGLILAVSLLIPARRFLPGYRPAALEALAYFVIPILECGLIALFLIARALAPRKR